MLNCLLTVKRNDEFYKISGSKYNKVSDGNMAIIINMINPNNVNLKEIKK